MRTQREYAETKKNDNPKSRLFKNVAHLLIQRYGL